MTSSLNFAVWLPNCSICVPWALYIGYIYLKNDVGVEILRYFLHKIHMASVCRKHVLRIGARSTPISEVEGDIVCQLTTSETPQKDGKTYETSHARYYIPKEGFRSSFEYDKKSGEAESKYDPTEEPNTILLFGVTEGSANEGKTVCIKVKTYPAFKIKIEDGWQPWHIRKFVRMIKEEVQSKVRNKEMSGKDSQFAKALADFKSGIADSLIVNQDGTVPVSERKEYFGFDFDKAHKFLEFRFHSFEAMQIYSRIFHAPYEKIEKRRRPYLYNPFLGEKTQWTLYEYNRDLPLLKFYHRYDITPAGWIRIKAGTYKVVSELSDCNINVEVDVDRFPDAFEPVKKDGIAPILMASFDIEALGTRGFPQAEHPDDVCFMIGTTVNQVGSEEILYRHMVALKAPKKFRKSHGDDGGYDLEGLPGSELIDLEVYEKEGHLLLAWAKFINRLNPDIVTGYNIFGFDMKYIKERVEKCGYGIKSKFYKILGRVKGWKSNLTTTELQSSALGQNFLHRIWMPGRVLMDVFNVIKADYNLSSYKLDNVSKKYLGDKKKDIPGNRIANYYQAGPKERGELAVYCDQDCALVNRLSVTLCLVINKMSMANVCIVPLGFIFTRGQGIRIFSIMVKFCNDNGYIIKTRLRNEEYDGRYEGSIVFDAKPQFHGKVKTVVLDFGSLYPRTAWNQHLSPECHVSSDRWEAVKRMSEDGKLIIDEIIYADVPLPVEVGDDGLPLKPKIFEKEATEQSLVLLTCPKRNPGEKCRLDFPLWGKTNSVTIPEDVKEGMVFYAVAKRQVFVQPPQGSIFSKLFGMLNDSRNAAKAKMKKAKKEKNKMQTMVCNSEQLAFKLVMNSTYGQSGARTSPIYYKQVAASITAGGRQAIRYTKEVIEDLDIIEGKDGKDTVCVHDRADPKLIKHVRPFKIIYGDTDSVFFQMNHDESILYNMLIGEEIADVVIDEMYRGKDIPRIHILEFEKVILPFAFLTKKRYFGRYYENKHNVSEYKDKSMGDASKRRDFAPIVKTIYNRLKAILLEDRDFEKAMFEMVTMVDNLFARRNIENIKDFVTSKSIKDKSSYKRPESTSHFVLAERIRKRDPGAEIQSGDRIPFVFFENYTKKHLGAGENIEDPTYVLKENLLIDVEHYGKHIVDAICPVLDMRYPNSKSIFAEMFDRVKKRKKFIVKQNMLRQRHRENGQRVIRPIKDPYQNRKSRYVSLNYSNGTDWLKLIHSNTGTKKKTRQILPMF